TSSTSPAGLRAPTPTPGGPATSSSGTTAACSTGRGPTTTARRASCAIPAWRAIRPPSWHPPIVTRTPARTSRPTRIGSAGRRPESASQAVAGRLAIPGGGGDPAPAQRHLLHLGGGGLGERGEELHVAGHREVGHARLAEVE